MDLILTESQTMLGDMIGRFLAEHFDDAARRSALADDRWPGDIWQALAGELGLRALPFSAEQGGFGGNAVDIMVVMEALGTALAAEPFLSSLIPAAQLFRHVEPAAADPLMQAVIAGDAILIPAFAEKGGRISAPIATVAQDASGGSFRLSGKKTMIAAGPAASHFAVNAWLETGEHGIFVLPAAVAGLNVNAYRLIDGLPACDLTLDAVEIPATALWVRDGEPVVDAMQDAVLAATCAESVGIMRRMLKDTVDYTSQRMQFGRKLSDFQVLQQRMAAMQVEVEMAASMALMAAIEMDAPSSRRRTAIAAAKSRVGHAARFVAQNAVQLHGGIGTTDELALGQYVKRVTVVDLLWGSAGLHNYRYAEASREDRKAGFV